MTTILQLFDGRNITLDPPGCNNNNNNDNNNNKDVNN